MKNKRNLIGNILLITGLVLLLGAGGLFLYNMHESNEHLEEAGKLTDKVKAEMSAIASENADETEAVLPSELEPVVVEDGPYDGILAIPAIELEMAVYDTWNEDYLKKSVCRYYGSPYTSDMVIAGHNYRSGFGRLKRLAVGDEVFFTDMNGVVTRYVVAQTEVLDGTDISGMLSGGWDLSLYTCTYGGNARFTVRCSQE
ncbi:MAG: sortase [Clostridiales bacterium]|nr:sortase [Clostridiales bacterium]